MMLASVFYLIVAGIGTGTALAIPGGIYISRLVRKNREQKKLLEQYMPKKARSLPESIEVELNGLREDLTRLLELQEFKTATALGSVIEMTQELFTKLKARGDEHQVKMAALSYSHVLHKLNKALSDDYFYDMLANPDKWTRVDERLAMVRNAVKAVNSELLQAIRDYNSYADIHYDVDMESILGKTAAAEMLNDLR
jgi:hypothetical protein